MKYIIFDLEFNSAFKINRRTKQLMRGDTNPQCPQEIIEIGAVKTNLKVEVEDTFKQYVKPQLYTKIHPKVKQKTLITNEDLMMGVPFEEAIDSFKEWIGDGDFILCSWGRDDINELKRNCSFHKINTDWFDKYLDIQRKCMNALNLPKGQQIGLKNALETLEIEINSTFHQALNDAMYTAKILKELKGDRFKEI
ncbi:3'-5' exonuclease [Alkaliphilus hydrothermalis]|uniref:Inhibitor of KinA sporulation pathway (Predicted exonuclease) n=1 Tax=Alkaliphilus hydrothermalis TaxID=1482730 RepID=A0ABS2NKX6_9FIRM|nr:3'-5' exonuclease [Alkaliphilus hydrothermalis]MBM7613557.1 inhibitor of KinA sporulation pathway (predicted exonuclease) [Alkaliphilus hydrothermalis]